MSFPDFTKPIRHSCGIDSGNQHFCPRVVGIVEYSSIFIAGMRPNTSRGWGTSTLARGATLDPRWVHGRQTITNQTTVLGFHLARVGTDTGDLRFRHRDVEVVEVWKDI